MNRIVYILVFQMLLLFGCKENKVCNISADIEGLSGGRAEHTVQYYSSLCGELESFTCKGDKFEITKEFDEPAVLTFYFENDTLNRVVLPFNQSICLIVIAQPGEDITINGKVTDYV